MKIYFKDALIWYRVDKNLARHDMAQSFGVSVATLANWERGKTKNYIFGYVQNKEFKIYTQHIKDKKINLVHNLLYEHMKLKKAFYLLIEKTENEK